MECEACTDRMVELLYGELPEADAEATRTHLESCDACSGTFGRVSTGHQLASMLELVDPPVSVLDTVMAAARRKAADLAPSAAEESIPAQRATPPREDEHEAGMLGSFLQWVGGFAMRPQMAMAMTLLLMVGLGMWYVPTLRQSDPADSHAIVDPAPGDEVGPSASLAPAEPLDLEADPVTGRILPRDEATEPRVAVRHRPPVRGHEEPEPPAPETPETPEQELLAIADDPLPSPLAPGEVIEDPMPDPRLGSALGEIAPGTQMQPSTMEARAMQPSTGGATERGAARSTSRPAMATQQRTITETAPMPSPAPQPALPRAATARQSYDRGVRRMRDRNYRGAQDDFESVVQRPDTDARRLLPSALHHLARSQSAGGSCPAAVRTYERLLGQHASYSGAAEAMVEAAVCYRRMGRLSHARRLLEQARTRPSVAARARRELVNLAQRERAAERSLSAMPAEAPSSSD